jgi:hypothetical protein
MFPEPDTAVANVVGADVGMVVDFEVPSVEAEADVD